MSDLISRSELIKELNKYCGNQRYLVSENIREIINNQPTAYYVDKVVKELQKMQVDIRRNILHLMEIMGIKIPKP